MRKNILICHSNASQLESCLNKHRYLSKRVLPGGADAKIFDAIKKSQNVLNRMLYPNIYHWYILICQFSDAARAQWITYENQNHQQQDSFIEDLLSQNDFSYSISSNSNIKESQQETVDLNENSRVQIILTPRNQEIASHKEQSNDLEFFLNIFSKQNISRRIQQLVDKPMKQKENTIGIEITQAKIEETNEGKNYYIYFKSTKNQCQQLKDQVSQWPEIQSFQIKKQKKNNPIDSRKQN